MRAFLVIAFAGFLSTTFGRNYYFSSSMGDDTRDDSQAQKMSSPWKTLSKLNSIFSVIKAGDSVLLNRGDVFYGSIIVTASGSANAPIVISSYGQGSLPVISGFVTLSKWQGNDKGIFTSSLELNDSSLNMVLINNSEYSMGRYPNVNTPGRGWLPILSHVKNNSITAAPSVLKADWSGAELVIRKKHYVIDRNKIISQENSLMNYKSGTQYEPSDGYGFFIQNHLGTLDQFGEWYYDPAIKNLNLCFEKKSPGDFKVNASNINTLVSVRKQDNISFENMALEGSNLKGFDLYYSKNISIKNCVINFSGGNAIEGYNTQNLLVENCTITNSNNNAFDLTGTCNNSQIRNNVIKNSGMMAGMAGNSPHSFSGININGDNILIEYNEVDSSGYAGIRFAGNSITIKNNFVNYFCLVKDDGGGIYTGNNEVNNSRRDQVIEGNIVLNGVGAKEGTPETSLQAAGIYLDDNSANICVSGNTMAYSGKAGIYLHNCHDVDVNNNTLYANATQLIVQKDAASKGLVRNNSIKKNIFFSDKPSQFVASFLTNGDDIDLFGKIDDNYYSRPSDDNGIISASYVDKNQGKINKYFDLQSWRSRYDKDQSSRRSPVSLASYSVNKIISPNKISNGNFDIDISGVHAFKCKIAWKKSDLPGRGNLRVASLPNSVSSYITIPAGSISSGKNYILKFSIKGYAGPDKIVRILLRQNGPPYSNLATTSYRNISLEPRNYEIAFSATKDEGNSLLIFALNDPATTYSLDNIQLYEAKAKIARPEDHFLFEYNTGKKPKTVTPNGRYVDSQNKIYTNNITLQPFTSVILVKQN